MKPQPHPSVRDWLDAQAAETLFLSSVTIAEMLFGIGALPDGKRKDHLGARPIASTATARWPRSERGRMRPDQRIRLQRRHADRSGRRGPLRLRRRQPAIALVEYVHESTGFGRSIHVSG